MLSFSKSSREHSNYLCHLYVGWASTVMEVCEQTLCQEGIINSAEETLPGEQLSTHQVPTFQLRKSHQ